MSKYGAIKTVIDGITFASKKEAKRYTELLLLQRGKVISDLKLQPRYPLTFNDVKICSYVADFSYISDNQLVVEDTKGFKTPEYKLKKKMMKALYGIDILET